VELKKIFEFYGMEVERKTGFTKIKLTGLSTMKKLSLSVLAALAFNASAEINFNGFATIAAGKTFEDDIEYHGMSNDLSFKDLSLFGLQASADLGDGLSATAQILSRGVNDFEAEFEWAYLGYQVNDKVDVKVGRLRTPIYYFSEYLDVSYAYHWLTPPNEYYAAILTNYDGFSVLYKDYAGGLDYSIQVGTGTSSTSFEGFGDFDAKYGLISNIDLVYDNWSTKLIYIDFESTLDSPQIAAIGDLFPEPKFKAAASVEDVAYNITGISSYLELGSLLIGAEYTEINYDEDTFVYADEKRSLLTAAYNFGEYTLHYSYSASDAETDANILSSADPRYPVVVLLGQNVNKDIVTHTFGMKYDFHSNASFKVDLGTTDNDYTKTDTGFARAGVALVF
jgi:hypothetical protein